MGFEDLILKTSCIAFHVHYNYIFMDLDVCYICWTVWVLEGLDWVEPMMILLLHATYSCIFMHTYLTFNIFQYIWIVWDFSECFSFFPLTLEFTLVRQWHLNVSLLRLEILFILGHRLLPKTVKFVHSAYSHTRLVCSRFVQLPLNLDEKKLDILVRRILFRIFINVSISIGTNFVPKTI